MHCERSFLTKRGLGVHTRAKHPIEYHEQARTDLENRVDIKRRWTEEETMRMARSEAKMLRRDGHVENINQELLKCVNGRTLDAIKGKRTAETYKRMVQDILTSLSP